MTERRFSWCMEHQHEACRANYMDWNGATVHCQCQCHQEVPDELG